MWLTSLGIDDIGSKHREGTVGHPTLEHGIARFDIVVAKVARIIAHEIKHVGHQVHRGGVYVVIIISGRLTLKDVTIVNEDDIVAIEVALLLHIGIDTRHAASHGSTIDEIVGEEATMYVCGLYELDLHCAVLSLQQCGEGKKGNKCQKETFHNV